ncbi:hypothetical protein BKA80DRAFT_262635 [Phyllosticta citrichinensis]
MVWDGWPVCLVAELLEYWHGLSWLVGWWEDRSAETTTLHGGSEWCGERVELISRGRTSQVDKRRRAKG